MMVVAKDKGFALTDVLTALFMLSTISVGLIACFKLARDSSRLSRETLTALVIAKDCIVENKEEIDWQSKVLTLQGNSYKLVESIEEGAISSERLWTRTRECQVRWTSAGKERDVTLSVVELRSTNE